MTSPNTITPDQLMRLVGTPGAPNIIDVRIDEDFSDDPRVIPTAKRLSYHEIEVLETSQPVVVICHKGLKLSEGAAAILRCRGIQAEKLEGGHLGWVAADGPLVELHTPPLLSLARIIRGADTNRHDLAPEAAGLMAISLGLSRMYRNDLDQLDAGMAIYDALHRWARDAANKIHDWQPGVKL